MVPSGGVAEPATLKRLLTTAAHKGSRACSGTTTKVSIKAPAADQVARPPTRWPG